MSIIDCFDAETPHDKSLWTKKYLICFVSLDQIPKINICHMFAITNPEVIEERQQLIAMDALNSEEVTKDGYIDNDGAALYEYDDSGSEEVGVSTGLTEVGTK